MQLHLSDWLSWGQRKNLPTAAGIYVISKKPETDITYIGRTWNKGGLRKRIQQFHRSATTGVGGHAGGVTFHKLFGNDVDDLHVRVHIPVAINPDPDILRPYIEYAERRLIWEYVEQRGKLPACNSE